MRRFVLLGLVALAMVVCVSAMPPMEEERVGDLSRLGMNNPCARECASDTACVAECAKCGNEGDEAFECNFKCQQKCMDKATQCIQRCAAEPDWLKASRTTARPQPRHPSLNTGYGPEKAVNWAGYVTVNGSTPILKRHLWYWFFESRNQPDTDPLILWMTGGPGCSGLVALFKENGPYIIADDLSLSLNPYSWNTNASIIFIDQPAGTGFSYADEGDVGPFNEMEIADNVYQFLQGFLEQNPKFRAAPFFLTGESYAGHYLPSVGYRVLEGNRDPREPKINLQAIAIGNGLVNPKVQYAEYLPFITVQDKLPQSSLDWMAAGLPLCMDAISKCNPDNTTSLTDCLMATATCNLFELIPFQFSGLNVYDVREKCQVPPLCYDFANVDGFLAKPDVAAALGVTGITWQSCNRLINIGLVFAGDWMRDLTPLVPKILSTGVRIVVYAGEYDFVCNWYGNQAWMHAMQWPGQSAFINAKNTTWVVNQQEAGTARQAKGLTFLRVKDAGHMVPLDQPARSLDMLHRVISGAPFGVESTIAEPVHEQQQQPTKPTRPAHSRSHTVALE